MALLERFTGLALARQAAGTDNPTDLALRGSVKSANLTDAEIRDMGASLLQHSPGQVEALEILAEGWENSDRKVKLVKVAQAWSIFRELIAHYAAGQLMGWIRDKDIRSYAALLQTLPTTLSLQTWVNAGGQLIRESEKEKLISQIHNGKVKNWEQVHLWYSTQGENYPADKLTHALAALKTAIGLSLRKDGPEALGHLLRQSVATREQLVKEIYESRAKDYTNPFRKMVYDSPEEMNAVVGRLQDNSFIRQEKEALKQYRKEVEQIVADWKLA